MTMQERGKRSAAGSAQRESLTPEEAEELAASFRPAWDVEDGGDESGDDNEVTAIDVEPPAAVAATDIAVDPFRGAPSPGLRNEVAPVPTKRPSRNGVYVAVGLAIALSLGLFLEFALSEDPKPEKSEEAPLSTEGVKSRTTTTTEIPPPPPKEDLPAAKPATQTKESTPTSKPLGGSGAANAAPRQPLPAAPPSPATPATAKAPPKGGGGGIVRDNPF